MSRIIVTLLQSNEKEMDIEISNDVPCKLLVEMLLKFLKKEASSRNDLEFSLDKEDWLKVARENSLLEVGVWDGIFIRVVENSPALTAPSIHMNRENQEPEQEKEKPSSSNYVWKVLQ